MWLRSLGALVAAVVLVSAPSVSHAFCGFFVSKADSKMFNEASQVVLVRDGDKTAITMVNDFKGNPKDFAMVIPVPTFIEREQINVGDMKVIDHLDAFTAPRLVEYHDSNPCEMQYDREMAMEDSTIPMAARSGAGPAKSARDLGVTIEASYAVGEYDILILSAKQSNGLVRWLDSNGYRMPDGAEPVVASYMRQGNRFFVAKVNVGRMKRDGEFTKLRPIQVAYESPKFMLPIRLGMVNSQGQQELIVYALSKKGRVESTNYRTVNLPSDMDIPLFVRDDFKRFYTDLFRHQTRKNQSSAIFTEYAWDMSWCDPCAASPLSGEELRKLGVFWATRDGRAQNVFVTRMHVRYDARHFPSDLVFHETGDRTNFQGRYVLRNPATGDLSCEAGQAYKKELRTRWERDARELAALTGWELADIRERIDWSLASVDEKERPWWKSIWD